MIRSIYEVIERKSRQKKINIEHSKLSEIISQFEKSESNDAKKIRKVERDLNAICTYAYHSPSYGLSVMREEIIRVAKEGYQETAKKFTNTYKEMMELTKELPAHQLESKY